MKKSGKLLKKTSLIAAFAILLTLAGYFSIMLSQDKAVKGKPHIEDAYNEDEDVPDEKPADEKDEDSTPLNSNTEIAKPKLTTGNAYSKKLVEEGTVNLLIIGEDKTSYLYDTIGIININKNKKTMGFIMIPRDTYIEYNEDIGKALKNAGKINYPGIYKINYSHHIGTLIDYKGKFSSKSISFLADVINEKFNIEADDYIKVNTEGFVKLVDHFGGIDINVPYVMNYDDPTQDLSIHLEKGMQHLDGMQSEGFVRFRQGWKEDGTFFEVGDTGRKKNQINFLKAFVNQHGTIKKINKLPGVISIMGKNMKSSIGVGDVLTTYTGLAKDIISDKYEIESVNLEGKQIRIKGSSYVDIE